MLKCMNIYMYTHVYIHICMYIHIYICIYICVHMSIHRCVPYRRSQPVWQPAQPAETTGLGDRAGRPAGPDRPEKQVAVARRNSRAADLAGRIGRRLPTCRLPDRAGRTGTGRFSRTGKCRPNRWSCRLSRTGKGRPGRQVRLNPTCRCQCHLSPSFVHY